MGRRHVHKKRPVVVKYFRINAQIRAEKVKLIDPENDFVGVVPLYEALERAQTRGLDLIEVSPIDNPPVVKILDHGKFKYDLEKKRQKSKAKKTIIKGVRLALNMGAHDFETRLKQTKKFLEEGDKAQLEMILQGREGIHVRRAFDQLGAFVAGLGKVTIVQPPLKKGKRITVIIQPGN